MIFLRKVVVLIFLFSAPLSMAEGFNQTINWGPWEEARALYDAGKLEDALRFFQGHPSYTGSFYYNIGTLWLKLGHPGTALAYLEKANRLSPHDSDIQKNLENSRSALSRLIGPEKLDPASTWSETLADRVSLDEVRGALGLVAAVLALFWLRSYLKTRNIRQTLFRPAGFFGLLALFITGTLYLAQQWVQPSAVCIDRQVIRSGPGDRFLDLAQLEPGTKVRVVGASPSSDTSDVWLQVRFSPTSIGWLRSSGVMSL